MQNAEQIAKELTLAVVEGLRPVNNSTAAALNQSLAEEIAKVFNTIYKMITDENPTH